MELFITIQTEQSNLLHQLKQSFPFILRLLKTLLQGSYFNLRQTDKNPRVERKQISNKEYSIFNRDEVA